MQATQASASAPVEVSWSPPSGGAATITGYRIFYGGGEESDNVSVPSIITYIGLILEGDRVGQHISIHSERLQLFSELINVTISCESQIHVTKPIIGEFSSVSNRAQY